MAETRSHAEEENGEFSIFFYTEEHRQRFMEDYHFPAYVPEELRRKAFERKNEFVSYMDPTGETFEVIVVEWQPWMEEEPEI